MKTCSNCITKTNGASYVDQRPLGFKILCNKCLDLYLVENWKELDKRALDGWKEFTKLTREQHGD